MRRKRKRGRHETIHPLAPFRREKEKFGDTGGSTYRFDNTKSIVMKVIRVFEAFAGYGSQSMALKRLEKEFPDKVHFEFVGISEIDPYPIKAYAAVHGDTPNYGDISKIDWSNVPDFDLFTYSSPCTDISAAGKQAGFEEGSGTRSSLLWECKRTIEAKHPKYLLMENVKAITQKKFLPFFRMWQEWLSGQGYVSFYKVLNAKDYGVPQNRERCFMVSILDESATFEFPKPFPLEKRLADVLEDNVDESFYLKPQQVERIVAHCDRKVAEGCGFRTNFTPPKESAEQSRQEKGKESMTPTSRSHVEVVGKISSSQDGVVISPQGIAPTHTSGHGNCPKVILPPNNNSGLMPSTPVLTEPQEPSRHSTTRTGSRTSCRTEAMEQREFANIAQ
jgi:DNA-cytosine methyltransferase